MLLLLILISKTGGPIPATAIARHYQEGGYHEIVVEFVGAQGTLSDYIKN